MCAAEAARNGKPLGNIGEKFWETKDFGHTGSSSSVIDEPGETQPAIEMPPYPITVDAKPAVEPYTGTLPLTPPTFRSEEGDTFDPVVGWLVCIEGATKGHDYRVHSQNNYIGRGARMDISIPEDPYISAENSAIIAYDNMDRTFYFGPGSGHNIVRINGKPALSVDKIEAYDVLTVGKTKLLFVPLCGDRFDWNEKK